MLPRTSVVPGSNPGVDAICWLGLLLVHSFVPRGFSLGTAVSPSPQKTSTSNFQFDLEPTDAFQRVLKNS